MIYLKALAFVYIALKLFSPNWFDNYFTPISAHKFGTLQTTKMDLSFLYRGQSIYEFKQSNNLALHCEMQRYHSC